jgi:HAD superfamily hydrolase (TIGR01509 family)
MKPSGEIEKLLKNKKNLIFDFDGTIADTNYLHEAAFNEALTVSGLSVDYQSIAGMKTFDAVQICLKKAGKALDNKEVDLIVENKQRIVRKMINNELQVLPGVDEFLYWAKSRFRLGMVTSGSYGTVSVALQKLRYIDWFDPLICADDVECAKPDPDGFLLAIKHFDDDILDSLIFEDSTSGLEAARCAGIQAVDVRMYGFPLVHSLFMSMYD